MAEQTLHHLTIPQYIADFELGRLDARELLVDALTNLRHFAAEQCEDFDAALDTSETHFIAERETSGSGTLSADTERGGSS